LCGIECRSNPLARSGANEKTLTGLARGSKFAELSVGSLSFTPVEPWPENAFPLRIGPEGLRVKGGRGWDSMQHICHGARICEKLQIEYGLDLFLPLREASGFSRF
jgi:hypothetical protein